MSLRLIDRVRAPLLAALGSAVLAAAPAVHKVEVGGIGMDGKAAMADLRQFARAQCRKAFGPERDGFTLTDLKCDTNLSRRVTFACRATALCDGSAYQEPGPAGG